MSQLKAELAAKSAEINECRNNQTRLERQLQISLDQKAQVSKLQSYGPTKVYYLESFKVETRKNRENFSPSQ